MYEEYVNEIEQLKKIIEKVKRIETEISFTHDANKIKSLEYEKEQLMFVLEDIELGSQIRRYGLTESLIKQASDLGVRRTLVEKEFKQNEYSLSSETIVSKITGKSINIKYLSTEEKIEIIYQHTGEMITSKDPAIVNKCNISCERFISELAKKCSTKKLKTQYGENWQEKVIELYTLGYNSAFDYQVNQIVEKVEKNNNHKHMNPVSQTTVELKKENSRLIFENKELQKKIEIYSKDLKRLNEENQSLKEEISKLKKQISDMQQEHKRDMEFLKESIVQINNQVTSKKEEQQQISYTNNNTEFSSTNGEHMTLGEISESSNGNGELVANANQNLMDYMSSQRSK